MVHGAATSLLTHVRQYLAALRVRDRADGELLAHFVATRDETTFAALVERHGPLVWGVCRRLLRDSPDARLAADARARIDHIVKQHPETSQ